MEPVDNSTSIAIVGMAGRFPGAHDVHELWRNLSAGVRSILPLSDSELLAAGVDPRLLADERYVKVSPKLDDIDQFDAAFFGYSAREAEVMDPQHRLFLECAWQAIEDAGYSVETFADAVGVFAGSGFPNYMASNIGPNRALVDTTGELQIAIGNERDSLSSTVSYKLNLRGPSLAVQTFCSTSLVAVHLACQSLLTYECGMALAGGVAIVSVPQGRGYLYQEGGIVSPDGHCRTFDARAQGSVMGSGVGVVLLKRMEEAVADGDSIHAVIRGSAVNNDGIRKVGYTAPGLGGQMSVIATALSRAGVNPESIGYIETHGTATPLGDAVEMDAMIRAFRRETDKKQFCALGSVKPNIGHLDRASGVTGLIKMALALKHRQLPPNLDFESASPDVDLENSPFYVNTTLREWQQTDGPRRAGVNSFGLGGTNAHVVLEEAPAPEALEPDAGPQLMILSAKTAIALGTAASNLARHLREHPELQLADVAYTLQVGRSEFNYRRMFVCRDLDSAIAALEQGLGTVQEQTSRNRAVELVGGDAELRRWLGACGIQLGTDYASAIRWNAAAQIDQTGRLETLGHLWLNGANVDWKAVWGARQSRRVALPSYPFQRRRYWIEPLQPQVTDALRPSRSSEAKRKEPAEWFYLPTWRRSLRQDEVTSKPLTASADFLIFTGDLPLESQLLRQLRRQDRDVVTVRSGESFTRHGAKEFSINPAQENEYYRLLRTLDRPPKAIVHMWPLTRAAGFDAAQQASFYSLRHLVRAIGRSGLMNDLNLWIVTSNAQSVTGSETLVPEYATITGACKVITQENLNIRCRHIDIDHCSGDDWQIQNLAEQLAGELDSEPRDLAIAYRSNRRWVLAFEPVQMPQGSSGLFRDRGSYLITGGLGGIGLLLAGHLARTARARLTLVTHSAFPPEWDWDQWVRTHSPDDSVAVKIGKLRAIQSLGAELLILSADAGVGEELRSVVDTARERFGQIDGVVYCAGATRGEVFGAIQDLAPAACEEHFQAKCRGLYNLEGCLGSAPMDFCIVFSSLAATLGGLGFFAYSAANSFADAFVHKHNAQSPQKWTSVNWDTWMTKENPHGDSGTTLHEYVMTPDEAVEAFNSVVALRGREAQLVNSTGDLEVRLDQWVRGLFFQPPEAAVSTVHPRPELGVAFAPPTNQTERTIAEVWQRILGMEVGIHDHFLDVGGNSLIATQVISRLRQAFQYAVPLTLLFETPTIAEMAEAIELAVIGEIEQLDDLEAMRLAGSGS